MSEKRINANRHYLIIAPKSEEDGFGYHHMLIERAFLADNIIAFMSNYPNVKTQNITIYELRELNE